MVMGELLGLPSPASSLSCQAGAACVLGTGTTWWTPGVESLSESLLCSGLIRDTMVTISAPILKPLLLVLGAVFAAKKAGFGGVGATGGGSKLSSSSEDSSPLRVPPLLLPLRPGK